MPETPENTNKNEKVDKKFENSDKKNNLDKVTGEEIKKEIDFGPIDDPRDYKDKLVIKKTKEGLDINKDRDVKTIDKPSYTKPVLTIRGMESNQSEIPLENKGQIIDTINSLGEFEKIKIKGCTDGSQINTKETKEFNEKQFNKVRENYIKVGGNCPSYDELIKSEQDPQNTILGYRRAMEGIISLNLTPEQMKKVEISNVLGKTENNSQERGFDVEADYTDKIDHVVESETVDFFYKLLGELNLSSLGRYNKYPQGSGYGYHISELGLKTNIDNNNPTQLYTRVMGSVPKFLSSDNVMQEKVQKQVKGYLRGLIYACGGEYNNGTWSSKGLTNKQYYTIVAAHDKLLSNSEFKSIMTEKNLSVLENKQLESGKTIKQFLEGNSSNPVKGVGNETEGVYRYYVVDGNKSYPSERNISRNDYILLGLYFQMKNS